MLKFSYFPLLIVVLFPLKLIFTYILALYYGHIEPIFPYISDAGTTSPEAGYFSMFLIVEAILIGITGWIRFQQIKYICNNSTNINNNNMTIEAENIPKLRILNKYSFCVVIIIVITMAMVAAFRSGENLTLHLLGALPAFGIIGIFFLIQTKISYLFIPNVNSLRMARIRLTITITAIIFGFLMIVFILLSAIDIKVPISKLLSNDRLFWNHSYGGYIQHCLSAIFEWMAILTVSPFFATLVPEFKYIESHNGQITFKFIGLPEITKI